MSSDDEMLSAGDAGHFWDDDTDGVDEDGFEDEFEDEEFEDGFEDEELDDDVEEDETPWATAALGFDDEHDDEHDDGGGPVRPITAPVAAGGGGSRRSGGRAARIVVLLVLLGMLAAGVVLDRREPAVTPARVTTAGLDGPEIPLADAVSSAWYCAAGTSTPDGTADETVLVGNLSPDDITASVTVDPGGGEDPRAVELRIRAYERASLRVADVVVSPNPGVIVEVAGGPAVVEHEIRSADDIAVSVCARAPSDRWYFAAGGTQSGQTQVLELFNPFGDDAIVDVTFLTEGGEQEPQALQGLVVGRRSKIQVPVTELVDRQERVATLVHTRTGRVVAEQVRTFTGSDGSAGLTLSLGATAARRQWTLPVGTAATGATGAVAIANFGLTPTSVEVSMLLSGDGVLTPEVVDVPSRSVVRFDPTNRVPAGTAYAVVVQAQGSVPVVAEALVTSSDGSATASGASIAARRWALAGSPDDASSTVIATNRGTTPLTVELRAYTPGDPNSPRSAPAAALAPGKTVRFDLDEWGIDPDQVLVVSADGPIVVGRETTAGGVALTLGVPFRD